MSDRSKKSNSENAGYISGKMVNDLSPKKTMLVLVIVVGCFAVLWPKVFHPMLVGSANNRIKPSPIDRTQGCCDVISDKDLNTIKIMSEICTNIIQKEGNAPLTKKDLIIKCQNLILETCGMDISAVLQEQVRLGHTTKQILEDIRSLNGSLCLKYNFGVAPWKLGVPHRVTVKVSPTNSIRQERPLHLRSEMVHPAFRERGRAIPQSESFAPTRPASPSRIIPKIVDGKPGPIPGLRPTIGGAGHVVPPSKHGGNNMGVIMPIYTIGIVVFFTYTVMKIVFKKKPEVLYPPIEPDANFRKEVFEADRGHLGSRPPKDGASSKIVVNAMSALLDEVDLELISRRKTSEVNQQDVVANGSVRNQEDDQSSVQVLGMETTASCEGGQKWTRPDSPILPAAHAPEPPEPAEPPQEIFLEGSLPPQSHLLVTDSATEAQKPEHEEDPAVVLAGKMTLSVISLDSSENGTDDSSNSSKKPDERSSSNVSEEFEKIDVSLLEKQIERDLESQFAPLEDDADAYPEVQEEICVAKHAYLEGKIEDLKGHRLEDEDFGDKLLVTHQDCTGESSESKGIAGLDETELSLLQQYLEDIEQETPSVEQVSSPQSEPEQSTSTGVDQESTEVEAQSKSELIEAALEEEKPLEQISPNKVERLEETELFEKEKLACLQEYLEDIVPVTPKLEPVKQVSFSGSETRQSAPIEVEVSTSKPSEVNLEKEEITSNIVEVPPEPKETSSSSAEIKLEECVQEVSLLDTPKVEQKSVEVKQTNSALEIDSEEALIVQSLEHIPIETEQKSSPIEVSPEEKQPPVEVELKTTNRETEEQSAAEPSQKSEDEEVEEEEVEEEEEEEAEEMDEKKDMSQQSSMRASPNYIEYESDSDSETEDANYEKA
ncbi:unnamed protein product [Phyllotreta striolata]|uniref:Resistance to inhibitors of cholinesterase protein 3 N-terminal domain-containing protein n=1 Tax=Phyllotreta striolata TaxID=444603 RepID=A0A9N9TT76_PHYSR|nr:unnamed protein product [Phyllotreta striolata]